MTTGTADSSDHLTRLVEWSLGADVLREQDVGHAVLVLTDTLAAIIGAGVEPEIAGFAGAATGLGGHGPSTLLVTGRRTSPAAAAMSNGMAAVRLELDEGNQFAGNHPSSHTFPAVLAVGEQLNASGAALLAASAAAYEVAVRVARGTRLRRAVHPFGTAMVCGAAVGVARLRDLDVRSTVQAVLVAAALTPASTQRAANTGATVRNSITGVCASVGVLAVELATTGTTGDPLALAAVFGEVLGESFDDTALDDDLGGRRYLTHNYIKLHACSRWNHAPIEATESIIAMHGFGADDVDSIEVATYDPAIRLDSRQAATGFAGKHSIPYSVAARVLRHDNGIEAYSDEAAADPALQSLMSRVAVVEDAALTAAAPDVRAARVTVRLRDGRALTATEKHPPGGFDRPYPVAVVRAKHRALLRRGVGEERADKVIAWCDDLPTSQSVRGLQSLVGGAP